MRYTLKVEYKHAVGKVVSTRVDLVGDWKSIDEAREQANDAMNGLGSVATIEEAKSGFFNLIMVEDLREFILDRKWY